MRVCEARTGANFRTIFGKKSSASVYSRRVPQERHAEGPLVPEHEGIAVGVPTQGSGREPGKGNLNE